MNSPANIPPSHQQTKRRSGGSSPGVRSNSNAMVQTFLAGEQGRRGNYPDDLPAPSDLSTSFQRIPLASDFQSSSDTLMVTVRAGQRAEVHHAWTPPSADPLVRVMRARPDHHAGPPDPMEDGSSASGVMMQVMEARRRAEEGGGLRATERSGPGSSSALIQAMLARQQAQNEYDDGY